MEDPSHSYVFTSSSYGWSRLLSLLSSKIGKNPENRDSDCQYVPKKTGPDPVIGTPVYNTALPCEPVVDIHPPGNHSNSQVNQNCPGD